MKRTGKYDKDTEQAVRAFQEMHNIVGVNLGEYDMSTKVVLEQMVHHLRKLKHAYL